MTDEQLKIKKTLDERFEYEISLLENNLERRRMVAFAEFKKETEMLDLFSGTSKAIIENVMKYGLKAEDE